MPARSLAVPLLRSRALGRLLALVGTVLVVIGVTTLPASAHHAEVSATARCDGTVSYTATAWNGTTDLSRTNPDIRIQAQYGNGAWVEVGRGAFASKAFAFNGSFKPTGSFPFLLRAVAVANWGDKAGPGQPPSPISVGAPSGCGQPPSTTPPTFDVSSTCSTYTVTVTNPNSSSIGYTVKQTGTATATHDDTARPGKNTWTSPTLPTGQYQVTVTSGTTSKTFPITIPGCGQPPAHQPKPAASVDVSCTGWSATLQNVGDSSTISFQITVNGQTRTETAGSTRRTVSGPVVPNSTNTVSVSAGGQQLDSDSLDTHTCQPSGRPTGSVTITCTGWSVTAANTGGGTTSVDFTVTVNGQPRTVSTDSTPKTITGPVVPNSTNTVSVSAGGQQLDSDSLDTHACQPPSTGTPQATIEYTCSTFDITLVNAGGATAVPFQVTANGQSSTVSAGSTPVHVRGKNVAPYVYSVSQNGTLLLSETFNPVPTCTAVVSPPPSLPTVAPSALIRANCTGFLTVLNNTRSTIPTTFVVTTNAGKPSAKQHSVRVPAGRTSTPAAWPLVKGVAQTVTVEAPQMPRISRTFSRSNCAHVSAPSTSTSTSGTTSSSTVSAPTTTAGGSTTAPTTLPKTGNQLSPLMLWVGGLLLLAGLSMMRGRRRTA